MTCNCKAEHWQPHAESCPEYKPKPLTKEMSHAEFLRSVAHRFNSEQYMRIQTIADHFERLRAENLTLRNAAVSLHEKLYPDATAPEPECAPMRAEPSFKPPRKADSPCTFEFAISPPDNYCLNCGWSVRIHRSAKKSGGSP